MIWLTWRQFRTRALVAAAALAAVAAYLLHLGAQIRADYAGVVGCRPSDCVIARHEFDDAYTMPVSIVGLLLLALPGLIGVFWGAPLITRELEERTDRLVWYQSVTRTRWLATKLAVLTFASVVVAGVFSLLLTWSASRYDELLGDRFAALSFAARNVVPLGYAAFALVLGTVAGLVVRRTLVAMAVTLAAFAVIQLVVPTMARAHLMAPVTTSVAFDEETMSRSDMFAVNDRGAMIIGYTMPGTWALTDEAKVFNADGTAYTEQQSKECDKGSPPANRACMAGQHLHFAYTYQPAGRYWPFQWIELSAYLAVTVALAALGFWWVRRRS